MKGGHTSRYVVVTVGDPRTIRISGKVISDIGIPVENMQVAAQEAVAGDPEAELVGPRLRSFTDEEGNFVIVGIEREKSYALNANLYGFRTSPVGFSIPLEINDMDASDLLFLANEIPKINIMATNPSTAEGQGLPTFLTVTRTGNLMQPLEVDFVMEGNATYEADYELKGFAQTNIADGKFYFPAGLNQAQIEIRVADDENYEGTEQISLRIKPWIITGSGKTMPPDWYIDSINLQTNYYQSTWDWMPGRAGKITLDLDDNDLPTKPQVTFVVVDEFASENGRDVAILEVKRMGDVTQSLDVPYKF